VIAALSVSGPTFRLTPDRIAELQLVLVNEAHALSERLGYSKEERAA
jgi:DNA-binding IclR family transcriptional regulator